MKKMICNELDGACDLEFSGNTIEEISEKNKVPAIEIFRWGDADHLVAIHKIKEHKYTLGSIEIWYSKKKALFLKIPKTLIDKKETSIH